MPEQDLNHLQRYLIEEAVEDYQDGHLTRRQTFKMLVGLLGSAVAANSLLAACMPAPVPDAAPPPTAAPPAAAATTSAATAAPTATAGTAPLATTAPVASPAATAAAQATAVATQAVIMTTATAPTQPAPTVAPGVRVAPDDPAIQAADVQFPGQGATIMGYMARPAGNDAVPPVLICHENRGLTEHIKDVTRRVAKAGFVGLAVDLLSRQGGTAAITDQTSISGMLGNNPQEQMVGDFQSGLTYLQGQNFVVKDRPGMVGFCFGGGITWLCAARIPALRAAVPFYGPIPPLEEVPNIQAAVLAMYGERDQRINAGIPTIEGAMQQNNKVFQKMIYPGAAHAFHNDTGANYNPQAATDAWAKTVAWFNQYLKA
jgi:carboxymethylenebutenolidase